LPLREDALPAEAVQRHQLIGDRTSGPTRRGHARRRGPFRSLGHSLLVPVALGGGGRPVELPTRVHLAQLAIDHPLEGPRPANVIDCDATRLTLHLDDDATSTDEPLEWPLTAVGIDDSLHSQVDDPSTEHPT